MKRRICAAVAAVFLAVLLPLSVCADVFDSFSDGDSFGGGFDFGGGDFDFGGGGYDNGGTFVFLDGADSDDGISFGGVIIVLIIVAAVILLLVKSKDKPRRRNVQTPVFDENEITEKIRKTDPDFSLSEFKSFASDAFVSVQEAWESQDIASVSPVVSEKLMRMLETFIADYKNKGLKNHLDFQNIKSISVTSFTSDGTNEVLTTKIDASLVDYVKDKTDNTVRGSETERHCRTYKVEFIRTSGTKTRSAQDGARVCPSCGAAVGVAGTGRCEYCGCVLTAAEYGWVMNSYGEWR